MTSSSLSWKKIGFNKKEKICCLGIRANEMIANKQESLSEGYIFTMFGDSKIS